MTKRLLTLMLFTIIISRSIAQSLHFDGDDDFLLIPTSTGINSQFSNNQITVEGWFYITQNDGNLAPMLIGESYLGDDNVQFALHQIGGDVYGGFYDGQWHRISTPITLNKWTHISCTYDMANLKLYINGELKASAGVTNPLPNGTEEWRIGRRWDIPDYYQGKMDELRIWNVARTEAEIRTGMYCTLASTNGLVAYYNFNSGVPNADNSALTEVPDITGNGIDATIYNFNLDENTSNFVEDVNNFNPSASITIKATATKIYPGTPVIFTATAVNGEPNVDYQWMLNGTNVGINSDTFTTSSLSNLDTVTCKVTLNLPCAPTNTATSNKIGISVSNQNGSSLFFDGGDDFIELGGIIHPGSSYTKEMWVNTNASICNNLLSSQDDPFYLENGHLQGGNSGDYTFVQDPNPFPLGTWTHVAITYDANTSVMNLYVNGILVKSRSNAQAYIGGQYLFIGRHTGGCYFNGMIDEVRIWDIARSGDEILNNMNCSLPAQSGLLANYDFNEGTPSADNHAADTLYDNSGNGYNVRLSNFDLTGQYSNWVSDVDQLNPVAKAIVAVNTTTLCNEQSATFTATAVNGGATPAYQWKVNGSLVGSNSDTYTTNALSDKDTVTCIITSSISCATQGKSNKIVVDVAAAIDTNVTLTGYTLSAKTTADSYQWIDCNDNNSPINGETNQDFTPTVDGTYALISTVASCSDTSGCHMISIVTNNTALLNQSVVVFPNPSKGNFTVTLNSTETASLQIFDALGKSVLLQSVEDGSATINGENLKQGIYILSITQNGRKITKQLTITDRDF